jgi:hypothetical protein
MDNPLAAEVLPEFFVVGDIIAVSQKHGLDSAKFFKTMHQLAGKPRRIDQEISFGAQYEIGRAAIRSASSEAAKINILVD